MGLFGKVPNPGVPNPGAPNGGRGRPPGFPNRPKPPMSAAEQAQAQYLRELKKADPAKWAEIIEIQLGLRPKPGAAVDPLDQMVSTIAKLKAAGLVDRAPDGTRSRSGSTRRDNIWGAITAALEHPDAVPQALSGVVEVGKGINGQPAQEFPPDTVHIDPAVYRQLCARAGIDPETGQDVAPPTSLAAHVPVEAAATPPAPSLPTTPRDGESWGAFIVRVIEPLPAERAAEWLWGLRSQSPEVGEALGTVIRLPDYALGLAYPRIAASEGFRELGEWCKANPDRAMDVIHAMQRLASAA